MTLTKSAFLFVAVAVTSLTMTSSYAGVHTNNLSECLVESTSKQDRLALVSWLFSAASFHPAVKSSSSVSRDQLDAANRDSAELFVRLLTESCKKESEKALKLEGQISIQASFDVLGRVAGRELFSDPEVVAAGSGLDEYLDKKRLRTLVESK